MNRQTALELQTRLLEDSRMPDDVSIDLELDSESSLTLTVKDRVDNPIVKITASKITASIRHPRNDHYRLRNYDHNGDTASYYFYFHNELDCHHQTDLTLTDRVINSVRLWPNKIP